MIKFNILLSQEEKLAELRVKAINSFFQNFFLFFSSLQLADNSLDIFRWNGNLLIGLKSGELTETFRTATLCCSSLELSRTFSDWVGFIIIIIFVVVVLLNLIASTYERHNNNNNKGLS